MADTVGSANGKAKGGLSQVAQSEAVDHLKQELQGYLAAQAEKMLVGVGRKLGETTVKLNDIAEGNSPGFAKLALEGGRKLAEGKGPLRTILETGAGQAKEKLGEAVKGLMGGKSKRKGKGGNKPVVIIESIDVGVPVRTAYDQWTQYQDFSTFAKGVKSASRVDDTTSDWQGKIWWSSRSWKGTTVEQIPDYKIQWSSEAAKGTHKGVVSFHRLDDNLTRILLVMEYYPSGFFEKTANIWRAQGRRVRLDFKNFDRYITLKGEAEDSWRGEIRDGEVVRTHEEAIEEEEREQEEGAEEEEEEPEGEYEEEEEEAGEEEPEDEAEGEYGEEEEPEDEYEEGEEEVEDGEEEDEYEDERAGAGSRR
ncbi:cyclase [Streptomyces hygroscopicus]|uniref:SRPBCC family protein n=1 Tax=Streptomyces hygroscopicus TaxID=1912 RepID=UPI00223E9840|nr:SRPBCC family protein [Streptomyces hygroscopicus]MCW7944104.1 cyclase [Streptomyces hygroscopicus]